MTSYLGKFLLIGAAITLTGCTGITAPTSPLGTTTVAGVGAANAQSMAVTPL